LPDFRGVTITDGCTADAVVLFDKEISLADYLTKYVEDFIFSVRMIWVSSHTIVLWPTPKAIDSDVVALRSVLANDWTQLRSSFRKAIAIFGSDYRMSCVSLRKICMIFVSLSQVHPIGISICVMCVAGEWASWIKYIGMNEEAGDERMIEEIIEFLRGIPLETTDFYLRLRLSTTTSNQVSCLRCSTTGSGTT
jgi:hypothetical protein